MIPSDVTQAKYFCGGDVLVVFVSPTSLPHSLTLSATCDQMKRAFTSPKKNTKALTFSEFQHCWNILKQNSYN